MLIFFQKFFFFRKILSGIPSECQTVWIQIRPNILLGLIWVQTVCKCYQQMTPLGKELITTSGLFSGPLPTYTHAQNVSNNKEPTTTESLPKK